MARAYGAYRAKDGTSERALFVIDARRRRPLELRLAGRHQSRRRRHPARPRRPAEGGRIVSTTQWSAVLTLPVTEDRDHIQGPADAPVTLVEYGDYECPYCGAAYPIVKEVQGRLGERLRFVFRNFPITTSHPHAEQPRRPPRRRRRKAGSGRCTTFSTRTRGASTRRGSAARTRSELGLDVERFDRELAEHVHAARVQRGLHERRPQRRERHADVLRQRRQGTTTPTTSTHCSAPWRRPRQGDSAGGQVFSGRGKVVVAAPSRCPLESRPFVVETNPYSQGGNHEVRAPHLQRAGRP